MSSEQQKSFSIIDYLNPFIVGASMVFNSLFNIELRRKDVSVIRELEFSEEVMIKIEFSGSVAGEVYYGFNMDVAFRIAEAINPGITRKNFNNEYLDVMGEIGNIIVGNAVSMIMDDDVHLSIPEVIGKPEYERGKIDSAMIYLIPLICPFGYINTYIHFNQK